MSKKILAKAFDSRVPNTPMSEIEAQIFMNILMDETGILNIDINDVDKDSDTYEKLSPLLDIFHLKVFLKRLELFTTIKMSFGGLAVLSQQFKSVGDVVMYTYYLAHKLSANTLVTAEVIAEKLFPLGFFSEQQLRDIWQEQKGDKGNMIDNIKFWNK